MSKKKTTSGKTPGKDFGRSARPDKADINALDPETGFNALHVAAAEGNIAALNRLLSRADIDLNAPTRDSGSTPLMLALMAGQWGAARALLQAGADIDCACGEDRNTPLHVMAYTGNVAGVELLLQNPRPPALEIRNATGWTALHLAYLGQKGVEIPMMLQDAGADMNAEGPHGLKPRDLPAIMLQQEAKKQPPSPPPRPPGSGNRLF